MQRCGGRIVTGIERYSLAAQRFLQRLLISAHVHKTAPLELLPNVLKSIVIMLRIEDVGRHGSPFHTGRGCVPQAADATQEDLHRVKPSR